MRLSRVGLLAALLLPCRPAFGQEREIAAVHQYVRGEMQRAHIPGLSIAVVQDGRVLLRRGYGFANLELRVPASDSTVYQSGSMGKQFTAAAVAMLVEQGRLQLSDTIVKWLPEGAGVWNAVTVRHLLTHTSGVAEYTDSTFDYRKDYTEDQLVRFAASRPLDFAPGARWSYSNTGYLLLGVLIHRVTGSFYGDVLHRLLFAPLGMTATRIISEADIIPNRAAGYQLVKGRIQNQEWVSPSLNTTADGSLYFSVNDLVRWAGSLDQRHLPDSTVLKMAWSPVRLEGGGFYPYGFGWDLSPQRGHPRIGHTGSWQGFKTAIYRYPEFRLTVIALANLAQAEPGSIAEGIAGIFQPALVPPQRLREPVNGPVPPRPVQRLLAAVSRGNDSAVTTPGLRRFLTEASRRELRQSLAPLTSFRMLGCDDLSSRGLTWLSSVIAAACYVLAEGSGEREVLSLYFAPDWRLAHFDVSRY